MISVKKTKPIFYTLYLDFSNKETKVGKVMSLYVDCDSTSSLQILIILYHTFVHV